MPVQDVEETADIHETIGWITVKRKLGDLKPFEFNPRFITSDKWGELKRSLKEDGYIELIEVNLDNVIISGHQRAKALYEVFGWTDETEIDVRVPERMLNEKEFRRHLLRANKKYGEFDQDMLANYFDDQDLRDAFFTEEELGMGDDIEEIVTEEDDDIPAAPDEPMTEHGDLWEFGKHRLLCGSATNVDDVEKLMNGKTIDMVFTDPPYGMNAVKNSGVLKGKYRDVIGDDSTQTAIDSFNYCIALGVKKMVFWGANYYPSVLPSSGCWLVWDKNNGQSDQADGELAWTNFSGVVRKFEMASEKTNRVHPTQKPPELASWVFKRWGKEDSNVMDLFGGSGSTMIACEQNRKSCFLMELDPGYCDVIVNRYAKYMEKQEKKVCIMVNGDPYDYKEE